MPRVRPSEDSTVRLLSHVGRGATLGLFLTLAIGSGVPASHASGHGDHGDHGVAPRTLAEIRDSGELVMLTFPHQQSIFSRTNLRAGPMPRLGGPEHFVGIDVDLMSIFARDLGVELKIRPVSEPRYAALLPDLAHGRGDLIASSLTITEDRLRQVDFAFPYFTVYPVVICRRDDPLRGPEDLPMLVAAAMAGSSHEERLLHLGVDPANIRRVDFTIETFGAVEEGTADYTVADSLSARRYLADTRDLAVAFRLAMEEHYGFAVPRDSELLVELNAFVERMTASGELQRIIDRHMPRTASEPVVSQRADR